MLDPVQVDEGIVVRVTDDTASFMFDGEDIVRYYANGVTVSRMEDGGELVSVRARWRFE